MLRVRLLAASLMESREDGAASIEHARVKCRAKPGACLAERRIAHGKREGGAIFGARRIEGAKLLVDRADGGLARRTRADAREALRACAVGNGKDGDVADGSYSEPIVAVRRLVLVLLAAHTRRDEVCRADSLLLGLVLGRGVRLILRHRMILPERCRMCENRLIAQGERSIVRCCICIDCCIRRGGCSARCGRLARWFGRRSARCRRLAVRREWYDNPFGRLLRQFCLCGGWFERRAYWFGQHIARCRRLAHRFGQHIA